MTLQSDFQLVFRTAEAAANGHEHCRKILDAVERCKVAAGLLKQPEAFRWVPVAESLPDDETTVLVALDDGEVMVGFREAGVWCDAQIGHMDELCVTHWADFPQPPK